MSDKEICILAIESSCDETAAAVVVNGRQVLSNVISTQIPIHTLYGGVVPEIASRKHIERINQVIEEALKEAHTSLDEIDAIGVTYGPGLVGALLVGLSEAKAISFAKDIPLVGVHHIEGHICANYIEDKTLEPPFLCLVVSGGHTHLVRVKDYGQYEILGRTRDDAAGEAFDKVARAIGLGYPGGPKIEQKAKGGDPHAIPFPVAKVNDSAYDFSFSGLKSAVLNYINGAKMKGETINEADIAASFQQAVIDAGMGGILWVAYLVQCQVGGDDQRLLAAVSAVYDVVDLLQCIFCTTFHAEIVNDKQGIAAELVHNIIPPGKAAVQLVQDSGDVCHPHRHFLLHQSVRNAPGKETLAGAYAAPEEQS